jgi:hypothetical protein
MSGSLSNYAENLVANWLFRTASVTRPSARYLAIHMTTPGESGGHGEATYEAYARKAISFGAPASGRISNSGQVQFAGIPVERSGPGAAGTAPRIAYWSLWTAADGGNCLGWGNLKQSKVVNATGLKFAAGDVVAVARGLTPYAKNLVLTWLLRDDTVTRPTAWYMALHRLPPGDSGAIGEVVGGENNYTRYPLFFDAPSNGVMFANEPRFGIATEAWPPVGYYSIWDDDVGGNCLLVGELGKEFQLEIGAELLFAAGKLNVRFS